MNHTNDIHKRTTQSMSLPTTCQPVALFVVCPHSVPSQCHTTLLPVSLLYSRLVGWLVSCYRTPLNTTLLLSALTIGTYLSCEPQYSTSSQPPSLSLSIPNIYNETTLYNSSHLIIYSTYTHTNALSELSDLKAFVGCAAVLACLSNTQLCSCMYLRTKCCHLFCHSVLT